MATDIKRIMEQLLGGGGLGGLLDGIQGGARPGTEMHPGTPRGTGNPAGAGGLTDLFGSGGSGGGIADILGKLAPPMGGAGQAAAAGGLLGSVLGGGGGGGLLRVGGMALMGLLAHRAYGQWKEQQGEREPTTEEFARLDAPDSQGKPFGLSVLRAMVAAARADGTLDAKEHERIFAEAERMSLSREEKAEIFRLLETTADPGAIARLATTDPQKAELYLASAMVLGGADNASERVYLDALSAALDLPAALRVKLDAQLEEAKAASQAPG